MLAERVALVVLCVLIIACTGIGAVPFLGGLLAFVLLVVAACATLT
jgi:hypothetical protein